MVASAIKATDGRYIWLVILAMLCAAISVYYYFRVIQAMYFKPEGSESPQVLSVTTAFRFGLLVLAVIIIAIGVMPQILLQYLYF